MPSNKHLTSSQRIEIESSLNNSYSFSAIAVSLNKHPSTISNEVKSHLVFSNQSAVGRIPNCCVHRFTCDSSALCDVSHCRKSFCRSCKKCNDLCSDFVEDVCVRLSKPPYVCNGCSDRHKCTLKKKFYEAKYAQDEYEYIISESRSGFSFTELEIQKLDEFLSPLIKKGQSIHHIYVNNRDFFTCSERMIYKLIDTNCLSAKNIDLPRKVRYRKRKKEIPFKVDKTCRIGRTYIDYQAYINLHPDVPVVEIDTVEGIKGGKVILTLYFPQSSLQLFFLRDANNSKSVIDIFHSLFNTIGIDDFTLLFPIILTDNGTEFSNPSDIEVIQGHSVSKVFYCDPSHPEQKGGCEKNHEEFRKVIPKGKNFDAVSQDTIDIISNNINSLCRKKLNDKTPFSSFSFLYGEDILNLLGVSLIPPNEVCLSPKLILQKEGV